MIYMLWEKGTPNIKIGITNDIDRRVRTLQTGNSKPILLIAYSFYPDSDERKIHYALSEYNIRLEWFHPPHDTLNAIAQMFDFKTVEPSWSMYRNYTFSLQPSTLTNLFGQ